MDWDEDRAQRIVRRVVQRKRRLFERYPEFGEDELQDIGMDAARAAHPEYAPARSAWTTWIYRAAACRILDAWRKRDRHNAHETAAAQMKPGYVLPPDLDQAAGLAEGDLAGWLRNVHTLIKLRLSRFGAPPRRDGRGRPPTYEVSQVLALYALKREKKLSARGLTLLLTDREDLRRAVGLPSVPHFTHLLLRQKSVVKIGFGRPAANKRGS